jgi:formamidopyrimidine-DNA glycosylase
MPELPEVETIARDLRAAGIAGKTLAGARVYWARTIAVPSPPEFCRWIADKTVRHVRRRGKFLILELAEDGYLLIHLRMSGRLHWARQGERREAHEHVVLSFTDGGELRFHDPRKFGRVFLVPDTEPILGRLGPEPLDRAFTAALLQRMLKGRRRQLKPLLLDQAFIAGLGNIYADEALWEAKIHPLRRAAQRPQAFTARSESCCGAA